MTHVRMRGTFMKVGQSLLVRKQLEMEKQLKEKMIHSVRQIFQESKNMDIKKCLRLWQ